MSLIDGMLQEATEASREASWTNIFNINPPVHPRPTDTAGRQILHSNPNTRNRAHLRHLTAWASEVYNLIKEAYPEEELPNMPRSLAYVRTELELHQHGHATLHIDVYVLEYPHTQVTKKHMGGTGPLCFPYASHHFESFHGGDGKIGRLQGWRGGEG